MSEEVAGEVAGAVAATDGGEGRERYFDVPSEYSIEGRDERREERASSEEKEAKRRRGGTLVVLIERMDRQGERFGEMERSIIRQDEEIEIVKKKVKVEKSVKELCDVKETVKRSAETARQTKE